MKYEEAKKMYEEYNCSEYNMKIDGVLLNYKSYNVPIELQEKWQQEFIEKKYKNVLQQKDLYSLNLLGSFAKNSTKTDILMMLYNIYNISKKEEDYYFLSKICCTLINSINLFHLKNDSSVIVELIDDVINTMTEISNKMENNEYIKKIFEENATLEKIKKLFERYKKEALKIKGKALWTENEVENDNN